MGLFSKKKKKELPEFPQLPEKPPLPEYRQQVPTPQSFRIKIPELKPEERGEVNIPIRRPEMPRPMQVPPRELAPTLPSSRGPQPLFVKIDRYKAAIKALSEIKQRISEAENTLTKLNVIKLRESDELVRWETEISGIKEKLMTIDKELFEV